ncbi:Disease resistance protein (TIR-NBS-LRR class) family [Melia azedarach]|uniref:Disease resistance protein (TIR-NBS-LRR class) family n=1 Tax=Melia azedarach TaxID=155640 RepID=A0ACC1YKS6_MELAZ|nr:Disease resistance protein (TIR-NBS-LRR class) family [Melia azedarach]
MNLTEFPPISGNVINLWLFSIAIEQISSSISNLTSLEFLTVSDCPRLKGISADICKLKSLSLLDVRFCPNLERFPESLPDSLKGDEEADLHGCRGSLLPSLSGLSGLWRLALEGCDIREIPQDIGCLSSLTELHLYGIEFDSLPTSIKQLSRLQILALRNCNMLESLPELPRSLVYLEVTNCQRLESLPELPECLESLDASQLETLYSDVYHRARYRFEDCPKLKENASNILTDSQLRIQHMVTAYLYEQMSGGLEFYLPVSAVDIPEWFSNRCSGSSITIQMPPQLVTHASSVLLFVSSLD